MANLNKEQQFKALVWETFSTMEKFDKVNYCLNKIRRTLLVDVEDFDKLKVSTQLNICRSVYHISINSKRSQLRETALTLPPSEFDKEIINYDPEFGFTEPEYVEVRLASGEIKMIESL